MSNALVPLSEFPKCPVPGLKDFGCVHCGGLGRVSCHVCDGKRIINWEAVLWWGQRIWGLKDCTCGACVAARSQAPWLK